MNYIQLYKTFLPYAIAPSVSVSYIIGITETKSDVFYPHVQVMNVLGVLSIGTLIGMAYPISIPLLAGRYLYRNR